MKTIKMKCSHCKKEMTVSESFKNAEVSHMKCAMKATEHLRKNKRK